MSLSSNVACLITDFNSTIIDLAEQLSVVVPNSSISNNRGYIKSLIRSKPKQLIELFVQYVLPEKPKIDGDDDSYFIDRDYSRETGSDGTTLNYVFEFKTIWKELSQTNRNVIRQYMRLLCHYAQEYFVIVCM